MKFTKFFQDICELNYVCAKANRISDGRNGHSK